MKILFISQYFYPEVFRGNDIAFNFVERGHEVMVISGIPNYPKGKFFDGYGLFKKNIEKINGVKIIHVPIFPRGSGKAFGLFLNYFSYAFFGSVYSFFLSLRYKYDLIFVQQLSPVTMSLPGVIVKKMQKIPMYLWVLDLWPESLIVLGGISNRFIINIFDYFVKLQYKNAHKILVSSQGFINFILAKRVNRNKIIHFPNWAESVFNNSKMKEIDNLPEGFLVMFAGNIGESQDFDSIMEATKLLRNETDIHFIFLGEGRKTEFAIKFVEDNNLHNTVHFLGRYPIEDMPSFFSYASIMLVTLRDDLVFNATAPAKLQAYMANGKPIVGMLNGDGADIIKKSDCGLVAPAANYQKLAEIIKEFRDMPENQRVQLGINGKNYCDTYFNKNKCLDNLSIIINDNHSKT